MNAKKKLFNNVKDYATKVMKCQDFVDYVKVVEENYSGAHKKARTETSSFENEPKTLREAYVVLNATILTMETCLKECFSNPNGDRKKETFNVFLSIVGGFLSLPEIALFMFQNSNEFGDNASISGKKLPFYMEHFHTANKGFFNSTTYEYLMYFLKKFAYVSAKKVYSYIENRDAASVEITNWKNECKKHITNWDNNLTKPDKWFNTDDLSDTNVLLGSVKIFMTAKMILLLED